MQRLSAQGLPGSPRPVHLPGAAGACGCTSAADRLRTTGAGIYIYENGLRVLEAVGAYDAAVKGAPFAHTREVRDDQNRTISTHKWQGSRVFSIVRQTVINALAEVGQEFRRGDRHRLGGGGGSTAGEVRSPTVSG